jgi:hypothetical protein
MHNYYIPQKVRMSMHHVACVSNIWNLTILFIIISTWKFVMAPKKNVTSGDGTFLLFLNN